MGFKTCSDIRFTGLTIIDAPMWTTHLTGCRDSMVDCRWTRSGFWGRIHTKSHENSYRSRSRLPLESRQWGL